MSEGKNDQVMYNKASGMYMKALAEMMKALDAHSEVRVEMNGKLLKRAMDDGFLCVMSNDIRRELWNYCYDNEILLARGPFPTTKPTFNCIGWAFPYHTDDDKQRVHRQLLEAGLKQNGYKRHYFRRFWYRVRSALRILPVEIPPNIVKINLTNAFYQTAVEVLSSVNLDTQLLYKNVVYAVSPTHYSLPAEEEDEKTPQTDFLERLSS